MLRQLARSDAKVCNRQLYAGPEDRASISVVAGQVILVGGCGSADSGSAGRSEEGRIADPFSSSRGALSARDRPLREPRLPAHSGRDPHESPRIGKTAHILFLSDPST